MQAPAASIFAAPEAMYRAYFAFADVLRRAQSDALGALGLGPQECRHRIASFGSHWRLRDYGDQAGAPSLLIVAAPIKRPYIWDLAPSVSAIRYCLRQGLHVYLLEWLPGSRRKIGLDEYAEAIRQCIASVARDEGRRPFLIGHSLGGSLAAIAAALAPATIQGLVLLGAPLCFAPATSEFRDALVALLPTQISGTDPFPGSLLSCAAAMAAPGTFIWSRLMNAAFSLTDGKRLEIHALVERWSLDEVPLSGRLVQEIMQLLFRENRFCRGTLEVAGRIIGPANLSVPTLAVVNSADAVAPLASVKPCLDAMPGAKARVIEFPGETGVGLQHLAILVGRQAYARVWPEIIAWLRRHSEGRLAAVP